MTSPQFSLRSLIVLTAFLAISIAALGNPNVWCAFALHVMAAILVIVSAVKTILSNGKARAFWATFLSGILVYLGVVLLLNSRIDEQHTMDQTFPYQIDVWHAYLGEPLWNTLHGEDRDAFLVHDDSDIPGWAFWDRERNRFLSFLLSLHILIAVMVSAVGAITAQYAFTLGQKRGRLIHRSTRRSFTPKQ